MPDTDKIKLTRLTLEPTLDVKRRETSVKVKNVPVLIDPTQIALVDRDKRGQHTDVYLFDGSHIEVREKTSKIVSSPGVRLINVTTRPLTLTHSGELYDIRTSAAFNPTICQIRAHPAGEVLEISTMRQAAHPVTGEIRYDKATIYVNETDWSQIESGVAKVFPRLSLKKPESRGGTRPA